MNAPGRPGPHRTRPAVGQDVGRDVLLAVALGGASGALLRHGVDVALPIDERGFPWPTLLVNVTGSAALAALGAVPGFQQRPVLRGFLGPGLLGGYTTLSAYAEQGRGLLAAGQAWSALGYLLGTLACCLAACVSAAALVRRLDGAAGAGGTGGTDGPAEPGAGGRR